VRHLLRHGVAWRAMPDDLPPWHVLYDQARRWLRAGCFEILAQDLYRRDGAVVMGVLASRIGFATIVLGSASGRTDIRLLAVFDTAINPAFPNVPTAAEQGFDVAPTSFGGLMAPATTPPERIARLESLCAEVAANGEPA